MKIQSWILAAVFCLLGAFRSEADCVTCCLDCYCPPCDPPGGGSPVDYTVHYAADLSIRFTEVEIPGLVPATPQNLGLAHDTSEDWCERFGYDSHECYIMTECKVGGSPTGPTVQCPAMTIPVVQDMLEQRWRDLLFVAGEHLLEWGGWTEESILGFLECYDPVWGGVFYCPM
jgi:hypothetical protein